VGNRIPFEHSPAGAQWTFAAMTEECPGHFFAATEDELWKLIEVHSTVAHAENPTAWSVEDRAFLKTLLKKA
jgi:hypothetical protein